MNARETNCQGCGDVRDFTEFPFSYCSECKDGIVDEVRRENRRLKAEVKRLRVSADYWQRMAAEALDELKERAGGRDE